MNIYLFVYVMYIKHPNKGKNMEEYLDCSLPPCYLSVDKHMVPIIKEMIGKLKVMSDGYWTDVEFGKKQCQKRILICMPKRQFFVNIHVIHSIDM